MSLRRSGQLLMASTIMRWSWWITGEGSANASRLALAHDAQCFQAKTVDLSQTPTAEPAELLEAIKAKSAVYINRTSSLLMASP